MIDYITVTLTMQQLAWCYIETYSYRALLSGSCYGIVLPKERAPRTLHRVPHDSIQWLLCDCTHVCSRKEHGKHTRDPSCDRAPDDGFEEAHVASEALACDTPAEDTTVVVKVHHASLTGVAEVTLDKCRPPHKAAHAIDGLVGRVPDVAEPIHGAIRLDPLLDRRRDRETRRW